MGYVDENGVYQEGNRTLFRVSLISDIFWGIVNFFFFLIQTLFSVRELLFLCLALLFCNI